MPADIVVDSISDYQLGELHRLKVWIYRQRSKARTDKDRAERREKREQIEAQREKNQPALLEF